MNGIHGMEDNLTNHSSLPTKTTDSNLRIHTGTCAYANLDVIYKAMTTTEYIMVVVFVL